MTDLGPEQVLVVGKHYQIKYRDALYPGEERTFIGKFERYVEEDDLCIFHEDNAHIPKAIVWSTEMIAVADMQPEG